MSDVNALLAGETFNRVLGLLRHFRRYSHRMKHQGIHPRNYSVLRYLLEAGSSTVGQIQEYLHKSPSTTSSLVAPLDVDGLLTRSRSTQDNRVVIVDLTPAGREIAERAPFGGLPLLRHRLHQLPAERLQAINDALIEIMELVEVADSE